MSRESLQKVLGDLEPLNQERQLKGEFKSTKGLADIINEYERQLAQSGINSLNTEMMLDAFKRIFEHSGIDANSIELFSNCLPLYTNEHYFGDRTSQFLSALIQFAYDNGHNNFKIHTDKIAKKLFNLAERLHGQPENLLKLEIFGDTGRGCFNMSECLDVVVHGTADSEYAKMSQDNIFTIYGYWKNFDESVRHTTLKTTSRRLVRDIQKSGMGNYSKLYFIDRSGKEIPVKLK